MDQILNKLTIEKELCFLDDLCIVSDTFEKHMKELHGLLQELEQSGLIFSFDQQKCILGQEISKFGIRTALQKQKL